MQRLFHRGHAVVVGVGADLPNTVQDAEGLAGILKDSERCAYPPDQVHLLTAEAATRGAILERLDRLADPALAESTVIVYFSGHGYESTSTFGRLYHLMPFGYDLSQLGETAISGGELAQRLMAIPAKRLLLLLDCCHAGGFEATKAPAGVEFVKAPLPREAEKIFGAGAGRIVIASSKASELSYAGRPYSAFTLALVEALAGRGASEQDGYVRAADLALYAREMVPKRTRGRQHPVLSFERADNFTVAFYAGGEKAPKALPFTDEPEIEEVPGQLSSALSIPPRGDVVIASGAGSTATGARAVITGGDVGGSIVTGDNNRIGPTMSGDFRGAMTNIDSTLTHVQQAVDRFPGAEAAERQALQSLLAQLETALGQVPASHAAEAEAVTRMTETLVESAAAEKPNRPLLQVTGEGLKQAAESLAAITPTVLSIATRVVTTVLRVTGAG